jgi:dethiobiotin synthetase
MFTRPPTLTKPGLFITATDTGVGKTVAACGIARSLRQAVVDNAGPGAPAPGPGARVGVCKPFATGCRRDREGLVSEDAETLAHFADCRQMLDVINPIRYAAPVAPAVAAELAGTAPDFELLARCLESLDQENDFLVVEGIGGLLVPLAVRPDINPAPANPLSRYFTVLDLALALGYPVVVVTRASLGTLNHTAMTVQLLRRAGCVLAGLVINGFVADSSPRTAAVDLSMTTNRPWLEKMTGLPILATVPACPPEQVAPGKGRIPDTILDALALTYWADVAAAPRPAAV